jgi:hypothetical protein
MSSIRLWAVLTAVAGLAALGTVFAFQSLPEVGAAAGCAPQDAVILYEFANDADDLTAIFGPPDSECRPKVVAALDAVNTLDVRLFIPAYTAFMVFAAMYLSAGMLRPWTFAAIAAALLACAADYVETINLLAYTPDLTPAPGDLATSSTAAWTKFAALAVNGLFLAALCFTGAPRRWILGALLCLPAVGVAMMALDLKWIAAQSLAFLASWVPLLVMAGRSAITGRA